MWTLATPARGFFTEQEKAQVAALFSQLVPSDVVFGIPGAAEAGAVNFVDLLLARPKETYVEIPAWATLYRNTLPHLAAASQARYAKTPDALSPRQLIELLQLLQAGMLPPAQGFEAVTQRRFFDTLHRHCVQGCFSDPRWGGNQERVMWKWFGYLQPAEER